MKNIYLNFMENIKRGNFVLPYCKRCKKNIWPPSNNCRLCLGTLSLEDCNNKKGKILEIFVSKVMNNDNTLMVLVDINEIILLGSISIDTKKQEESNLIGNLVRIKKCGFIDNKIFYEFEILNKFD